MSWDLHLVPADHGDDAGEWLEQHAADRPDIERARRHADAIVARIPELEVGGPFDYGYQLTLPEETGVPLDVDLYGNHASLGVAYWDLGEQTAQVGETVRAIVGALQEETGWVAYDPQEDRIVDADEITALFGSGHEHGVTFVEGLAAPEQKPKKKRRFGLF